MWVLCAYQEGEGAQNTEMSLMLLEASKRLHTPLETYKAAHIPGALQGCTYPWGLKRLQYPWKLTRLHTSMKLTRLHTSLGPYKAAHIPGTILL